MTKEKPYLRKKGRVSTIAIFVETRERLKAMGKKDETYDEIIQRLLAAYGEPTLY